MSESNDKWPSWWPKKREPVNPEQDSYDKAMEEAEKSVAETRRQIDALLAKREQRIQEKKLKVVSVPHQCPQCKVIYELVPFSQQRYGCVTCAERLGIDVHKRVEIEAAGIALEVLPSREEAEAEAFAERWVKRIEEVGR
jgi:hypothetical protein